MDSTTKCMNCGTDVTLTEWIPYYRVLCDQCAEDDNA